MMGAGGPSAGAAQTQAGGSTTRSTTAKLPLAPAPIPPSLPDPNTPFSLDSFLAHFSAVPITAAAKPSEGPQHSITSHQQDASVLDPYASPQGGGDMFDFFFSVGASNAPCTSGVRSGSSNADIVRGGDSAFKGTNTVSAGAPVADGDSGAPLSFDFASLFFQGGQDGAYQDIALHAAGKGGSTGDADASSLTRCVRKGSRGLVNSADAGVVPDLNFLVPDDQAAATVARGAFILPPTSRAVDSAAGAENKCAPPLLQAKRPEAAAEGVEDSAGDEAAHIGARPGVTLAAVKSAPPHHVPPVGEATLETLPHEDASSAMDHEPSLAAALAAAPPSSDLLSAEVSQQTAALASCFSEEDAKRDEAPVRSAADRHYPEMEAFARRLARGMTDEEAMPAPAHTHQFPSSAPAAPLARSSHPPGAASAGKAAPPTPPSPRTPPTPLVPPLSTAYRPQAPLPTGIACSDATSVALQKAMAEAEEVCVRGLDMEGINGVEGHSAEMGAPSTGSISSSSDAAFFAQVAQLQQQTARLTEDSAQSAAALQALTTDLLRILGPHAALSSLAGEQYAKTPLVHLQRALIVLLEGLVGNAEDAVEDGGDALTGEKEGKCQPAVSCPSSADAEIGSSGCCDV
ncbi:hypothetical protein LSCM1_02702 [Leishmania martiniquensis]|uniref:Uncharacterized protein n=1 Tax=Leishmania martiniquensis TaxID=1580590 RepID=A0A836H244_9TRYP|nr:hypothetical protein LSCM1_02702 [Leishmania martiniquensis]